MVPDDVLKNVLRIIEDSLVERAMPHAYSNEWWARNTVYEQMAGIRLMAVCSVYAMESLLERAETAGVPRYRIDGIRALVLT